MSRLSTRVLSEMLLREMPRQTPRSADLNWDGHVSIHLSPHSPKGYRGGRWKIIEYIGDDPGPDEQPWWITYHVDHWKRAAAGDERFPRFWVSVDGDQTKNPRFEPVSDLARVIADAALKSDTPLIWLNSIADELGIEGMTPADRSVGESIDEAGTWSAAEPDDIAPGREELWVTLPTDSLDGEAVRAMPDMTFAEWAKEQVRTKVGANDRLKRVAPPSEVVFPGAKSLEALEPVSKEAGVWFVRLDAPRGTERIGGVVRKKGKGAPRRNATGPASVKKIEFTRLPKTMRWKWQDLWIDEAESTGLHATSAVKAARDDADYDPSQDIVAGRKETVFAISGEGHAAALVDGEHPFFYDDGWVDARGNEAATAQAIGLLGLAGYDVRRLMPQHRPEWGTRPH